MLDTSIQMSFDPISRSQDEYYSCNTLLHVLIEGIPKSYDFNFYAALTVFLASLDKKFFDDILNIADKERVKYLRSHKKYEHGAFRDAAFKKIDAYYKKFLQQHPAPII